MMYMFKTYQSLVINLSMERRHAIKRPASIKGDINSHITTWGYNNTNNDAQDESDWADIECVTNIHMMVRRMAHSLLADETEIIIRTS